MSINSNIKVSVIVPVYNEELYLHACLKSLVNQTLNEIEVILINDFSTDSSGDICDEYCKLDSRFTVIHNTSNIRQGLSMNKGIEIAKGEYISLLGADDWVDYDYYEKLYESATSNNSDIAKTGLITHYLSGKVEKSDALSNKIKRGLSNGLPLIMLFTHEYTTAIYRREMIIKYGIVHPDIRNAQDIIFLLNAAYYAKSISFIKGTYYHYRHHTASTTRVTLVPYFESSIQCFQLHMDFINTHLMDKSAYDFIFYRGLIGTTKRLPLFLEKPELAYYKSEYVKNTLGIIKQYKYDSQMILSSLQKGIYYKGQISKIFESSLFTVFLNTLTFLLKSRKIIRVLKYKSYS